MLCVALLILAPLAFANVDARTLALFGGDEETLNTWRTNAIDEANAPPDEAALDALEHYVTATTTTTERWRPLNRSIFEDEEDFAEANRKRQGYMDVCDIMAEHCWERCGRPLIFPFTESCRVSPSGEVDDCLVNPFCSCNPNNFNIRVSSALTAKTGDGSCTKVCFPVFFYRPRVHFYRLPVHF